MIHHRACFQSVPPGTVKRVFSLPCFYPGLFDFHFRLWTFALALALSPRALSLSFVLLPIVRRQQFTVKASVNNISPAYKRYVKATACIYVAGAFRASDTRAKAGNCAPRQIDHCAIKSAAIKRTKGDYRSSWITFGDLVRGALFPPALFRFHRTIYSSFREKFHPITSAKRAARIEC